MSACLRSCLCQNIAVDMVKNMKLKKNQLAMSNFPYYKHSLKYTLDSLQRLGAEAIELYAVEPHFHIDDTGPAELHALKHALKSRGLRPICLTPEQMRYPINIAASNPIARKRSIDVFTRCIQYAHELECPIVQFHAGYNALDEVYEDGWSRSVESIGYLVNIAESYGVTLTLEYVNIAWKTVVRNSKISAKMIETIGSKNLKAMSDTICMTTCGETIEDVVQNIGKDLMHFHFTDGIGDKNSLIHMIPGEGNLDLVHMIDVLGQAGYTGHLSIELISPYEEMAEEAMKKSAEWMWAHLD